MAENSKSLFGKLALWTQNYGKRQTAVQLFLLVDEIVRTNRLVASKLQERLDSLDVESYPTSTSAPKYRLERLIKDLEELSDRLMHLKHLLQHNRVRTALRLF